MPGILHCTGIFLCYLCEHCVGEMSPQCRVQSCGHSRLCSGCVQRVQCGCVLWVCAVCVCSVCVCVYCGCVQCVCTVCVYSVCVCVCVCV